MRDPHLHRHLSRQHAAPRSSVPASSIGTGSSPYPRTSVYSSGKETSRPLAGRGRPLRRAGGGTPRALSTPLPQPHSGDIWSCQCLSHGGFLRGRSEDLVLSPHCWPGYVSGPSSVCQRLVFDLILFSFLGFLSWSNGCLFKLP